MGKAEVGSTKHLANKMKQKGLTRLRWYCQICEKPCRDENGFKMHLQSPSHFKRALEVGENFGKVQDDFSKTFQQDFISTLKSSHGEKAIHANKFYQEIIQRKDHVHLNSTKWHSLTEFVKYLGREGICRVEEQEDGLFIAWIDDSPEAMRRRESARRKDMMEKGDEEREQLILKRQIERARRDAEARGVKLDEAEEEEEAKRELKREEGEKVKLSFGTKKKEENEGGKTEISPPPASAASEKTEGEGKVPVAGDEKPAETASDTAQSALQPAAAAPTAKPVSLKFGAKPQTKNVFKNAFAGAPKKVMAAQPKKMSEAERIMKEELERKRARESGGNGPPNKRPRF
ncbi:domain of Kin17 curved DNA-binding protein-domain-containing protein [Podospora australis]|uniref:Domain of Kin17 curved DNA-binding protein-domain-containing protein n=1 Tax=Podospora australis TaxID=1536484 RepID=A0AAN6X0H5_9PEZI|nr:domain of Kin17 curved DNA-binding protein-domain-containing protein [Podospora australis]